MSHMFELQLKDGCVEPSAAELAAGMASVQDEAGDKVPLKAVVFTAAMFSQRLSRPKIEALVAAQAGVESFAALADEVRKLAIFARCLEDPGNEEWMELAAKDLGFREWTDYSQCQDKPRQIKATYKLRCCMHDLSQVEHIIGGERISVKRDRARNKLKAMTDAVDEYMIRTTVTLAAADV